MANSAAEINRVFPTILSCLAARVSSPLRLPLWPPTANNTRLKPALASLNGIVEQLIATKRRRIARGESDDAAHQDLLTILMLARDDETGEAMSDAQLRDEVISNPKSSLGTLLSRFRGRMATADEVRPEPRVTLRPSRSVVLQLEEAPLG